MTAAYRAPEWDFATEAVHNARKILIISHFSPDGDAIGSMLGLANALKNMGKKIRLANDDGVPEFLSYIPLSNKVERNMRWGEYDLVIYTDCADEGRWGHVGGYARKHAAAIINLDHHITNTGYGDIHLVVPDMSSAAEVAFHWLKHAEIEITPEAATALLTGIVTDTIGFRITDTKPATLQAAQELMAAGASLNEIMARTLESKPYREFQLWQSVLPTAQLDGKVLQAVITVEDIKAAGIEDMTDAGLVGFLRTVNEAMIAVVFKQDHPIGYKISLRSKLGYNVAEVASQLGGGGHIQAAGAQVEGTLEEVRAKVMPLLHEAVEKGDYAFG